MSDVKTEKRPLQTAYLYAGYPADAYPIDPKTCTGCIYRNSNTSCGLCNYITIVGHSRPKTKSTRTYCEAKETGKEKKTKPKNKQ